MDINEVSYQRFEEILKNQNSKRTSSIYTDTRVYSTSLDKTCTAKDVISSVTSKLRALQCADKVVKKQSRQNLAKYKKSLVPVTDLCEHVKKTEPNPMITKQIDTQCVTDTQLLDIVQKVEECTQIDREISREFDTTFDKSERLDIVTNSNENKVDLKHTANNSDSTSECKGKENTETASKDPSSPVLKSKTRKRRLILSPHLVFDLKQFESFEQKAAILINSQEIPKTQEITDLNHNDDECIYQSQILGKHLNIETKSGSSSPLLPTKLKIDTPDGSPIINIIPKIEIKNETDKVISHIEKCTDSFLKDEILFSSDEENDLYNEGNALQVNRNEELPLTCVLETSFYTNQSNVLDKTIYVGFQTASNKVIKVDSGSFERAKSFFENDMSIEDPSTVTELVEKNKETLSCKKEHFPNKTPDTVNLTSKAETYGGDCQTTGFDIIMSEIEDDEAIQKVFHDLITSGCEIVDFKETEVKRDNKHDIKLKNPQSSEIIGKENHPEMHKTTSKNGPTGKIPSGFVTASNKKIELSNEALARQKRVFQDIDLNDAFQTKSKEELKKDLQESEDLRDLLNTIEFYDLIVPSNANGFLNDEKVTDLNKENSGHSHAKDIVESIVENSIQMPMHSKKLDPTHDVNTGYNFTGFKTASNKNINISKEALAKTKAIFGEIDSVCNEAIEYKDEAPDEKNLDNNKYTNMGFKTASNKNIGISKEALKKSKILFQNIDAVVNDNDLEPKQTTNTANVNDSKHNSLNKQCAHKNIDVEMCKEVKGFIGFQTASLKPIEITEEALRKTRQIFDNVEFNDEQIAFNSKPTHSSNGKNENKYLNETDGAKVQLEIHKEFNDPVILKGFAGFQTASLKPIEVTEAALRKTKQIFDNIELNDERIAFNSKPTDCTNENRYLKETDKAVVQIEIHKEFNDPVILKGFAGFQTASNKKIQVSKDAFVKTRKIFSNIEKEEFSEKKYSLFSHYDNKKPTKFKENTSNLFDVIDVQPKSIKTGFCVFQTANNKKINVSETALAKSRQIFAEIDNSDSNSKNTAQNLKTDRSKDDKVSEKKETTVLKTKNVFDDIIEPEQSINTGFCGFQTASNKHIKVSHKALAQTKSIFQSIDDETMECQKVDTPTPVLSFQTANKKVISVSKDALENSKKLFEEFESDDSNKNAFMPFQTGRNKSVNVSEKALKESKNMFNETANDKLIPKIIMAKEIQKSNNGDEKTPKGLSTNRTNADIQLDTQILDNFQQELNTEDFCDKTTPKAVKRSASPILSCPKAKRKSIFKTPYKLIPNTKVEVIKKEDKKIETFSFDFDKNYKKNKILDLKLLEELEKEEMSEPLIDTYLHKFCFEDLLNFEFGGVRNDINENTMNMEEIKNIFLNSVNQNMVPNGWLDNHIKLILWKLISYEIKYPNILKNVCSVKNLLNQLKYRYDKELYNVQRPALRKILEKDETPNRTMVLCVARIFEDGVSVASIKDQNKTIEIELTDGWYCIITSIDKMLTKLVFDRKIAIGSKIATHGAELVNCDQGKAPWEDISNVRLKIFGNSTRLARWDARLGFHGNAAILNHLSNVKIDGGKISKTKVFVTRVYPMLYVEKFEDGSTVTRSERLEQIYENKYENERQMLLEKLYEEVEKELSDQESQDSSTTGSCKRKCLDSGSQIAKLMKKSKDPSEFRTTLTETQMATLQEYTTKQKDKLLQNIQEKVQEKMDKYGICKRNVVSLLKIRVASFKNTNCYVNVCKGMLSIWRPNDAITEILQEGQWIDIMNALPTAMRYSELQLSAGRQTIFNKTSPPKDDKVCMYAKTFLRKCYTIQDIQKQNFKTEYDEIDIIGIVIDAEPKNEIFENSEKKYNFQNVYIADIEKRVLCLNFWGGIKKIGFENILDTGQIVYCKNLQKRIGNTRKNIPQYRVTELTYITKTPKNVEIRKKIEVLSKKLSEINRKTFIEECCKAKNSNFSLNYCNTENISPYKQQDYSLTKNKKFMNSPQNIQKKMSEELNLTGLDFESTFKQNTEEISPKLLLRKQQVREKIEKLKKYGEPPPLSPIQILNISKNANKSFKVPFNESKILPNFQDKVQTTAQSDNVLPGSNRMYVKTVINPVKLDFSKNTLNESGVDNFAEEFESSPPLSLD